MEKKEEIENDVISNRLNQAGMGGGWSEHNNKLLRFAETQYTYDVNGNATQMTLDGTVMFTYHYNTHDRLVQVDDVNGAVLGRYYYDPFGRRLWKQAGDETTLFFYSDEGLVAEYDPTGAEIRSYGYRPDSTWTTDPLWLKQEGEYYFYHNDHLGTPHKLVAQNGAVVWSASYTAFGQATVEVETVTNNLRFPGQYFDAESGLHYNLHRYYVPLIGRYIKNDPLGLRGGINLFSYAQNTPLNGIDPLGLQTVMDGLTGNVIIAPDMGPLNDELYPMLPPPDPYEDINTGMKVCIRRFDFESFVPEGIVRDLLTPTLAQWAILFPPRHCYIDFGAETLSFDDEGIHSDRLHGNTIVQMCFKVYGNPCTCNEICIRNVMSKCPTYQRSGDTKVGFHFLHNNCCDCARRALSNCGCKIPGWIKWRNFGY
ncbi:MAG: RHS repeat-associated core domain-containing protein [Candidatus Vecturithrix sp.]|jgi:RHS repeat-associated protein|nr:RHS repeat-associated core domain-containing protein [Candidatus Vecturithrix sp.]